MTQATTTRDDAEPLIKVDTSVQYKVNAGQCTYCGNYKTWEFRIENPKSGKMIPGHVTKEGFKINDGDCPYFTSLRGKKRGGSDGGGNYGGSARKPLRMDGPARDEGPEGDDEPPRGLDSVGFERTGSGIRITFPDNVIECSTNGALKLVREILANLIE